MVRAHFCCVFFLVQNSIMLLFKKILVLFVLYDLLIEKSAIFFFPLFLSVEGWFALRVCGICKSVSTMNVMNCSRGMALCFYFSSSDFVNVFSAC